MFGGGGGGRTSLLPLDPPEGGTCETAPRGKQRPFSRNYFHLCVDSAAAAALSLIVNEA